MDIHCSVIGRAAPCAECRRTKVKCDRAFPCYPCRRKNCPDICPDGEVVSARSRKTLQAKADVEQLAERVESLMARIHDLEDELASMNSPENSNQEADILTDTLADKAGILSPGEKSHILYYGDAVSAEYCRFLLPSESGAGQTAQVELPHQFIQLMQAFPFGMKGFSGPWNLHKALFLPYFPTYERATYLADLYYENVAWMSDPIPREYFSKEILNLLYDYPGCIDIDTACVHKISLFFTLMAHGACFDDDNPNRAYIVEHYYGLSRAAFSLYPAYQSMVLVTIRALCAMISFLLRPFRHSTQECWLLLGICVKLTQAMGLHRESSKWHLSEEEQERRRKIYWDVRFYDTILSLLSGRPPSLFTEHCDTKLPVDAAPFITESGEAELGWHAYRARYIRDCLSVCLQHAHNIKNVNYGMILDLCKKIRDFSAPSYLQAPSETDTRTWSTSPQLAMRQFCVLCTRECAILYLHRSYFAQAVKESPDDPLKHVYAKSVLESYNSARMVIERLRSLYTIHALLTSRICFFWSSFFSSYIALGSLVAGSPGCSLSPSAMDIMETALPLFEEGSKSCLPERSLDLLKQICTRAQALYSAFHRGLPLPDDGTHDDELDILGGYENFVDWDQGLKMSSAVPSYEPWMAYTADTRAYGTESTSQPFTPLPLPSSVNL